METIEELKKKLSEGTKICSGCKIDKPKSEYHKCSHKKTGIQSKCKECMSSLKKQRYWGNREVELAKMTKSRLKPENVLQRKSYYEKNKENYRESHFKYMANEEKKKACYEASKVRYQLNKDKIKERHKRNYNKPETKEKIRAKHNARKKTDATYVIRRRLRFRLRNAIEAIGSNKLKYKSAIELLGCDLQFFKTYLDGKFSGNMSWEKVLNGEIHIDHIKPCSLFDLKDLEEQKKCFHYTNLQPLWAVDNLSKNNKYEAA